MFSKPLRRVLHVGEAILLENKFLGRKREGAVEAEEGALVFWVTQAFGQFGGENAVAARPVEQ